MIPSIDELKGHCRIDSDDNSEDSLITTYSEAAREKVGKYINRPLFDNEIPAGTVDGLVINSSVKLAIMLAVNHFYDNRDATTELPPAFFRLLDDYRLRPGT